MGVLEVSMRARGRVLADEAGLHQTVRLQPPASAERIAEIEAEIEAEIGFALPRELRDVLAVSAGLDLLDSLDLASVGRCSVQ